MFCENCGSKIEPGTKFCSVCGNPVAGEINKNVNKKEDSTYHTETNADDNLEFRIVNRSGLWTGTVLLCIFAIIIQLLAMILSESIGIVFIPTILIAIILTCNEKKIYLSDYTIVYSLKLLSWGILCIFRIWSILYWLLFIISIIDCYMFIQMNKTRLKVYKSRFLMISFIECGVSLLLIVLCRLTFNRVVYVNNVAYYSSVVDFFGFFGYFSYFLFSTALLLRALSISNEPGKNYISLAEPAGGKHILIKNIGFTVFLSIITLGLYEFFIWSRSIIISIHKLEGKNMPILGEWLCFMLFFPYHWYWFYTRYGKLSVIFENNKVRCNGGGGIFILLDILQLSVVNMAMIQATLNQLAVVMRDGDFVFGTVIKPPQPVIAVQNAPAISNADELMKYKNLLDAGVISQEEFENVKQKMFT